MHFLLGWPSTLKLPSLPPLPSAASASTNPSDASTAASAGSITEPIRQFARNKTRTKIVVVTDTAVYLFHLQQCDGMCVGVWRRSPDSLLSEGTNGSALFSPDDTAIAVTTTRNVLNVLKVREINQRTNTDNKTEKSTSTTLVVDSKSSTSVAQVCAFPDADWHDTITMNAPSFSPIHLQLQSRVKLANDYITCASHFGGEMVLGTRGGYIQVVSWDGQAKICVDPLAWTNSHSINTRTPQSSPVAKPSVVQVTTCVTLGLVAFVFSDGSAGLCDTSLLQSNPTGGALPSGRGILLVQGGARPAEHATRVAFNSRYRLLAIGLETGDVSIYRVATQSEDDSSSSSPIQSSYLRRYSIGLWGFTSSDVGSVKCMEWSPDGSVLAVGWSNRGLVIWSTGGTRVACTLPMLSSLPIRMTSAATANQPSPVISNLKPDRFNVTAQHSTPHQLLSPSTASSQPSQPPASELLGTGVSALTWGAGGASLLVSGHCNDVSHGFGSVKLKSKSWQEVNGVDTTTAASTTSNHSLPLPSSEARCGCGLVTRLSLVRSPLSQNPSQNEATSLSLLGDDRIVLWAGKRSVQSMGGEEETNEDLLAGNWIAVQPHANEKDATTVSMNNHSSSNSQSRPRLFSHQDRFLESDSDWEHIQLPAVYLSHSWPIQFCALSASGNQIACAGSQGLICYNRLAVDKKWRRFGNVIHEEQVHAAGLGWYGEHIVCVASRGMHQPHQLPKRTSTWSPPPPAARMKLNEVDPDTPDTIELLFFPRTHLDNSSLLHTHVLHNARSFHSIDISDHTLMVYLSVGQLLVYQLRAEVHPAPGRKTGLTQQQALLSKLGIQPAAFGPIPYSTLPYAHDNLGLEHELRMALELAYVVDLCAPLKSISTSSAESNSMTSLQSMLASPPLQCRLWLSSADSVEDDQPSEQQYPPTPSTVNGTTSDGTTEVEQVYELPLFCPNVLAHGLEALHATTLKGRNRTTPQTNTTTDEDGFSHKSGTVLSCILLTSTGTLIAIDIGTGSTSVVTPSSSLFSPTPSSSGMRAWARIVSTEVEQFWLHEMSAVDPLQTALQYLQPKKIFGDTSSLTSNPSLTITPPSLSHSSSFSLTKKRLRGYRLFSYGARGFDVWFRLGSTSAGIPPSFESTKLLDFDPEVYPLGLDSNIGVIVGITKGLRTKSMWGATSSSAANMNGSPSYGSGEDLPTSPFWGPIVCFRLQTKLQPYLHGVLMHLVTNESTNDQQDQADLTQQSNFAYAFEIANLCRSHSYFPVSLELLLHTALNPPSYARRSDRDRSFSRVVTFLRRFPEFPDIVINCARKNDSSCWSRLFTLAGTPSQLFHLCLTKGKLRMASCYLIVIQRTEGMIVAREHAKLILQRIETEEQEASRLNMMTVQQLHASSPSADSLSTPSKSSLNAAADSALLPPPISSPLSSSPSVVFRRRRRLSALESELQRFIALTHGMEEEMLAQRALAIAEEAALQEAERRKQERKLKADSSWLPSLTTPLPHSTPMVGSLTQVDAKHWSDPSQPDPIATSHTTGQGQIQPSSSGARQIQHQEQEQVDDGTNGNCQLM